jgi:hypothetical protein
MVFFKPNVAPRVRPVRSRRRRVAGLSLVETIIVVVIAIVLLSLIGVLVGGVNKSRAEAVCRSNLNQIGRATLMYSESWDGSPPPWMTVTVGFVDPSSGVVYEAKENSLMWKEALKPFAAEDDLFFCPVDARARSMDPDPGDEGGRSQFTSYQHTKVLIGRVSPTGAIQTLIEIEKERGEVPYLQDRQWQTLDPSDGTLKSYSFHGKAVMAWYLAGNVKRLPLDD